jgi:hypothetical protein
MIYLLLRPSAQTRENAVALLIVLAFIVLLAGMTIAYLSRTGIDRQIAHSSFNQAKSDQLARSALDVIIGDLKEELVDGSTSFTYAGSSIFYVPSSNANVVPMRSGTPGVGETPIPNLVRRSIRSDPISPPAIGSRASSVNSATDVSSNGRSVSLARWNAHYLVPKVNTSNDASDPVTSFVAPDWVLVSRNGPAVQANIGFGTTALNNSLATNTNYIIGRYAYAIYDEGGLLDINVAGFPSPTPTPAIVGRKGITAFADLTALPTTSSSFVSNTAINRVIGWRNYATVHPTGTFPGFTFSATAISNFVTYFLDTTRDFRTVATNLSGGRTDQNFMTRAELIKLRADIAASVNMLQYVGTFSREQNRPTWRISPIDPLTARFAIGKLAEVVPNPPNPGAVRSDFGLKWNSDHWEYWGVSGTAEQSSIPAITSSPAPDFFQLLNYGRSNAPIGETLTIGASLIDQYDTDDTTTVIEYAGSSPAPRAYGMEALSSPTPSPAPSPPPGAVILNRPFRNVGEFGYAYKTTTSTLDFKSSNTDAGLLDLFTYNTAPIRSGLVSLNTRNASIVAAIIKGALPTEASTAGITNAQATSAATSIVNAAATQPAVGRSDVARLASAPTNSPFTTNEENRETIARALAEVGQTRTWGILVDVIAQSGRYPPNASAFSEFVVEGEKRYWLHVAIDRFTGEVIDRQLEEVFE